MERYERYKDSGVEWIGEIPSHWEVANLGALADVRKRKNTSLSESNVLSLSYGKIKRRVIDNSGLLPDSFETYNIINEGDVVLRLTDLQNDQVSLRVGRSEERGIITSAYLTLIPRICSRFLFYELAAFDYCKGFYGLAGGVRQSLSFEGIKNLRFVLPDLATQQAIADYLDAKTAEIDSLIEKTERSIELLEEYRKSVISEAVTKGLDPDAPMKDSGIEWIGEIPEGWLCLSLDRIIKRIQTGPFGSQLHAEDYTDDGMVYVVNPANIVAGKIDIDSCKRISSEHAASLSQHLMQVNEIVFGRRGEMGRCALVETDGLFCGTGCIEMELLETVDPSFTVYYL